MIKSEFLLFIPWKNTKLYFVVKRIKLIPFEYFLKSDQSDNTKYLLSANKEPRKYESAVIHGLSFSWLLNKSLHLFVDFEFGCCRL